MLFLPPGFFMVDTYKFCCINKKYRTTNIRKDICSNTTNTDKTRIIKFVCFRINSRFTFQYTIFIKFFEGNSTIIWKGFRKGNIIELSFVISKTY